MAIKVPVIVSYDNKGTKQAIKGIGSLEKSFKKMSFTRKLTFAAGATAVTAFGKKAVTAALEESKAVAVLNNQLKNLGLAFAATGVNAYIDNLQRATAVSEDKLRPAFSTLIRATSDLGKAQQLLALTLDISASTGFEVEQVAKSLSKAYLGQNTALGKLGVGLTKTELKTLNFEQIQKRLTVLFKGGAAAAVDTYAGSVAKLQIAAKEASETIGFALVEGVKRLGDDKGIEGAASAMEKFASEIGFAITGMAVLIDTVSNSTFGKIISLGMKYSGIGSAITLLAELGKATVASENTGTNRQSPRATEAAAAKARLKAIEDRKKLLALQKQSAAADKLKAIFDMDLIQLTAAKQGKLSAEELARVNALIAIKTTAKNDDVTALNELEALQKKNADAEVARQNEILATHKRNGAEILALSKANAAAYADFVKTFTYPGGLFAGTPLAPTTGNATNAAPMPSMGNAASSVQSLIDREMAIDMPFMPGDPGYTGTAGQMQAAPNVTVNLQGGINIGSQYEFYESVWRAIENSNTFGNSLNRAGTG
jgi:hypothetical protein